MKRLAIYNDNDRRCAAWLRELIAAGLIANGVVSEQSITEIEASELRGYTRVHLFAGIGGWDYALRLAGWPADRPVWTGSCPCQPFSVAGCAQGVLDKRHLWPAFRGLIVECRPATVFGEQVASPAGRAWLAGVRADLEALGYAVGAADLCAAGEGAPHIRQRLYWVADAECSERRAHGDCNTNSCGWKQETIEPRRGGNACGLGLAEHGRSGGEEPWPQSRGAGTAWSGSQFIECRDGKHRRIPLEPALFPLAHGVPGRVGLLRGYGNAIVPQVAARFVMAYMEATQ